MCVCVFLLFLSHPPSLRLFISPPSPSVQNIKKISPGDNGKQERFRLTISDGTHKQGSAMLATQMNSLLVNEEVVKYGSIRLKKFMCNVVQGRTIIIILNAEVVDRDLGGVIGESTKTD